MSEGGDGGGGGWGAKRFFAPKHVCVCGWAEMNNTQNSRSVNLEKPHIATIYRQPFRFNSPPPPPFPRLPAHQRRRRGGVKGQVRNFNNNNIDYKKKTFDKSTTAKFWGQSEPRGRQTKEARGRRGGGINKGEAPKV